jgi:hypothetical protein
LSVSRERHNVPVPETISPMLTRTTKASSMNIHPLSIRPSTVFSSRGV